MEHVGDRCMNPPEPGPTGTILRLRFKAEITVEGALDENAVSHLIDRALESLDGSCYGDADIDEEVKNHAGSVIESRIRELLVEDGDGVIRDVRLTHYEAQGE